MEYPERLMRLMERKGITMSEAIGLDLCHHDVDCSDDTYIIDHIEAMCHSDMDMVQFLMGVYVGNESDYGINKEATK